MPKRAAPITRPDIHLDPHAPAPLYKQLYARLRTAILGGQLQPGGRLPSTRVLAGELGVSRNTTALAYELLLLEGYIESRVGAGTLVALLPPAQLGGGTRNAAEPDTTDSAGPQTAVPARRSQLLGNPSYPGDLYSDPAGATTRLFRIGQPDVACFPYAIWARLVARRARQSLPGVALYQNAQGYAPLREAIAAHIGISRGVHCGPDQIILTAGAQGALDLVARVLLDPGDRAWVEDPGYVGARGALLAARATLVPVPVDPEGCDVAAGRRLGRDARLAVVTPSHQFPTAVTMSLRRRLALLAWAREGQAWIVEDDYDSEYRFSGRPLEALHGLDRGGRVIYVGTFSKVLFPSLRLGYLVAPAALLPGLIAARRFSDVHLPLLEQMALADFMVEGHFARHVRKTRLLYLERRNALVVALNRELGDVLDVAVPEAGLHLVAWLRPGLPAPSAAARSAAQGLAILAISQLSLRPLPRDGLLLGFASASPAELQAGVHLLARALRAR
ncbi:MAG: PLP-dependent aminotransferase family protein [Candidatus Dormibacteraeota bacterium]|nr:PLP-dependent aminotransferase family protein [Candidatus Dormibacteraeota bacterium]